MTSLTVIISIFCKYRIFIMVQFTCAPSPKTVCVTVTKGGNVDK